MNEAQLLASLRGSRPPHLQYLLDNPDLFLLRYFGDKLGDQLKPFHLRMIDGALNKPMALLLEPAQHGKTTIVSTLLPILAVCRNPNIRIAIIGKNDTESEGIMRAIQAEMTLNDQLIEDFGPFKDVGGDKPWALGMLSVAARTARHKEQNITVFGSGARTVLGHRTDWTICDDVVTNENSATPEQRHKVKEWFNQSVSTGPVPATGRLTVVGTRFDPNDLYGDLEELHGADSGENLYHIVMESAIVDEEDQEVLWPERMPYAMLMQKKLQIGTLDFNKRYNNIAVDASRLVFREEYVRGGQLGKEHYPGCLDKHYAVGSCDDGFRAVAGFDPAIGVQRHAKFCAHVTLAVGSCIEHDRCLWVVDLVRDQMTLQQQVDVILRQHDKYNLTCSYIEANSYQKGLHDAVEQKMAEVGVAFRMQPHYTHRLNKPDPEIGVQALAPWFERGRVHIPWADPHSRRVMGQLVEELVQYPGRTTDCVMALWIAWRALDESAPRFQSTNYLKRPMAWGTVGGRRKVQNPYYADRGGTGG